MYNAIIISDTVSEIKILNPFISKSYAGTTPVWEYLFQHHFHAFKHSSSYYTSSCLHTQGITIPYKLLHYYLIQSHKNTISWKPIWHNILTIIGWPHILHDSKNIYKKKYLTQDIQVLHCYLMHAQKFYEKRTWWLMKHALLRHNFHVSKQISSWSIMNYYYFQQIFHVSAMQ